MPAPETAHRSRERNQQETKENRQTAETGDSIGPAESGKSQVIIPSYLQHRGSFQLHGRNTPALVCHRLQLHVDAHS